MNVNVPGNTKVQVNDSRFNENLHVNRWACLNSPQRERESGCFLLTFPLKCPVGSPIGNSNGNPIGKPIGNPLGIPIGNPIGKPTIDFANCAS